MIDYTREDFTRSGHYDLILDIAGSRSWSACRRVLEPNGTLVLIGAPRGDRVLGPLRHVIPIRLASMRSRQKAVFFIAKPSKPDLAVLRELAEAGNVTPAIERQYKLSEIADALHLGEGHAQGKLGITM